MTLALRDLQAAFARHLAGAERRDLVTAVVGDTISAGARLRVHRHNLLDSLTKALASTFPTVLALVGDGFFRQLAHSFIATQLPKQPVLSEYGAGFAAFIDEQGPAGTPPYLADMARIDWALNVAFHSPIAAPLTQADLAAIPVEELASRAISLTPGTALIRSPYPVGKIWAAAQPDASDDTVALDEGEARLLVFRRADDAAFVALGEGEAAFALSLMAGETLEQATETAFRAEAGFNLAAVLARFVALACCCIAA